jgi:hypothetical protein
MLKKSLLKILLNVLFALIGCIVGAIIGGMLYKLLPFWSIIPIGQAIDNASDILFVDYSYFNASHLSDAILYIQTQTGDVYSLTQKNWQKFPILPDGKSISQIRLSDWNSDAPIVAITTQGEAYQLSNGQWKFIPNRTQDFKGIAPTKCAAEWYLPVFGVKDSAGTVFSHALADEYVCYVLLKDGHIQAWHRMLDAFSLMNVLVFGDLVGLVVGFNAIAIKKRVQSVRVSKKVLIN